jgi:heme exporter protein A
MSEAAVSVDHIWKFYGDFPALRDISVQVEPGTCTALLGRNGAGKTTLLRTIAGLSRAARGQITIFGKDVRQEQTRRRVGVLGHAIGIYDELSAIENLRLFARLYDIRDAEAAAGRWLERVGLERVATGMVREFSRGMRQRLAVARAFLHDPDVLLLDEPFTSLDDRAIAVLQTVLRQGLAEGRTVIMSTHQLREALELATHVALINRGKLAFHGVRTPEMLGDPGWLYRNYGEA